MKLKVVRLADHFPSPQEISYGLEPTFYYLSLEQARLGLNVHVICRCYPHQKTFEETEGVYIHRVKTPYSLLMLNKLFSLSHRIRIDIIHAHATSGLSYALARKSLLGRWTKTAFIAHVHGTTKGILSAQSRIVSESLGIKEICPWMNSCSSIMRESITWKSADVLIANSKFLKEELANLYGIPRENVHVVHNGVDLQTFFPRKSKVTIFRALGLDLKSHLILYLGGFRLVKGSIHVVKAFEKIHNVFNDAKLLFVGGKHPLDRRSMEALPKSFQSFREKGVIQFIGNIPHRRLPEYLSAADVLVVPSMYDTFPKVILEAMACGTPVVASAVGGIPEIITNNETGILVEPSNEDMLAEAIMRVISDHNLREKISSKTRRLMEEQFSWKEAAKRTLMVYENVLANGKVISHPSA